MRKLILGISKARRECIDFLKIERGVRRELDCHPCRPNADSDTTKYGVQAALATNSKFTSSLGTFEPLTMDHVSVVKYLFCRL